MSLSWSLLVAFGAPVLADIAPRPPAGERFVAHHLEVKGLPKGRVLLVADDGDIVSRVVSFEADGNRQLQSGRDRGARLGAAKLWSMSSADFAAWQTRASAEVAQQREDCANGKGCAHISRFVPKMPAPAPRVDCGASVDLHLKGPASGPATWTDVVRVKGMTDTTCDLRLSSPNMPSQCSTGMVGTSAASLLLGVGLVAASRRRKIAGS